MRGGNDREGFMRLRLLGSQQERLVSNIKELSTIEWMALT